MKLKREFYHRDSIIVAKELLGKILIHEVGGKKLSGKIVETEAYMGIDDKAAHSYGGKRTPRNEIMYGEAGFSYVFLIYGLHSCFNVVVNEADNPQAVLIRAVEPIDGSDEMSVLRYKKPLTELSKTQIKSLTNGPGKLSNALGIDRSCNGADLCGSSLYIEEGREDSFDITTTKRVGIDYAEEAVDFPWRYYITGNPYISVK